MSKFKNSKVAKATSVFVSVMTSVMMLGGAALPAAAVTASELQAQINALLAQLQTLTGTSSTGSVATGFTFTGTLRLGSRGTEVMNLQKVLNSNAATQIAVSGAGSPGNETTYFGAATQRAVIKFQELYKAEILTPVGLSRGTGLVGAATRAKLNALSAGSVTTNPGTTPTTPSTGTGLTVSSATQPSNTLAPATAARVPFTRFTLTAGNDGDVTVNGIVVERGGLADDAVFADLVLLDENGNQIGIAKTLNSDHRATIGDTFVVPRGTSKTYTVAGNMASLATLATKAGQVAVVSVVGVNTGATVTGSLPITGASNTINASLTIGSVTMQRGSTDPGTSQTKEVGTTAYTFASVKVTAGSAEKVYLQGIRWNQTGSAGASDVTAQTYVDGVAYPTTISTDGKYYTSTFSDNAGKGILIDKGFSKDIAIKGDIKGGSGRTVDFDIAKRVDVRLVGELYGYGITPPQTGASVPTADTAAFSSSEDPWYDSAQVTVSAGTLSVSSDSSVAAQNIAVNVNDQVLGGFSVETRGESISVSSMVFNITAVGDSVDHIDNIVLVDGSGKVLAGPVDGVTTSGVSGTVTFTSGTTFPAGTTKLVLKGKLTTDFVSNDTVQASTTPSTQWTNVRGLTTGNTITPTPASALSGNTMTVRAGSLNISVSSQPVAQTVIAGSNEFEFARYIFDATQSGEDIRVSSLPALLAGSTSAANVRNCYMYEGSTKLSAQTVVNPSAAGDQTFTFDGTGLVVPKGTSKIVSLKCDLASGATGTVIWGLTDNDSTYTGAQGIGSGQVTTEVMTAAAGQTMTIAGSGSYTVTVDAAQAYEYRAVRAGTNVSLGALKFTASVSEDLTLKKIALALGNTASSAPADLVGQKVTLHKTDGTKIGEAQFGLGSTPDNATSTLSAPLVIAKGETVTVVIKADLISHDANTNAASTATNGGYGAFVAVNYDGDNNGLDGNYATGNSSGATISGTSSDVSTNGVRVFRNVPTLAVTSTGGTLAPNADLYKFTVTNPDSNRDLAIKKFTFEVSTTGGAVSGFTLFGNGVAANASAVNSSGAAGSQVVEIVFDATSAAKLVPAGSSKTYILKASTVADGSSVAETISINLAADSSYPSLAFLMGTAAEVESGSGDTDNTIWSPFSTTTAEATAASELNLDWTNGYGLPGFPAAGQDMPSQSWTRPA